MWDDSVSVVDLSISVGDIASLLVVVGAIVGFGIWVRRVFEGHDRQHVATTALVSLLVTEASEKSAKFKAKISGFNVLLGAWEKQHAQAGNPITAAEAKRRQDLSGRLEKNETLTNQELVELQAILQKELADAQATNADLAVVIAILVILGVVVVAIALAARS